MMTTATTTGAQGGIGVSDLENLGEVSDTAGCDRLVALRVVAERLGLSTRAVYRLIASGVLPPPVKIGKASRWFTSDVEGYMDKLRMTRTKCRALSIERGAA